MLVDLGKPNEFLDLPMFGIVPRSADPVSFNNDWKKDRKMTKKLLSIGLSRNDVLFLSFSILFRTFFVSFSSACINSDCLKMNSNSTEP